MAVLLLCLTAIIAALLAVFKDTYTNPDVAMMRTSSGKIVMANSAKYPLPLYTAPVLPARSKCRGATAHCPCRLGRVGPGLPYTLSAQWQLTVRSDARAHLERAHTQVLDKAQLYSIEQLTVKVADRDQNATAQSGHRIAATRWYSDTRVVFVTTTGAEIKVWDGKATFQHPNPVPEEKPQAVCAAEVSCSAFLVDDVNRQEAVIAEANKALADKNLELSRGGQSLRRRLSALRLAAKEGRQLQVGDEDCNPTATPRGNPTRCRLRPRATQPAAPRAPPRAPACSPVPCTAGGPG